VDGQGGGGAVGVLERVVDAAVGGAGVQGSGDAAGGADRDVAGLGVQFDRAVRGLGDVEVALLGADLGGAIQAADGDVAGEEGEAGVGGLVELDRALGALEGDVAEVSHAPEVGAGGLGLDAGAGGSRMVTSRDPEAPRIRLVAGGVSIRRTPSV
jgi:hypothetical protein